MLAVGVSLTHKLCQPTAGIPTVDPNGADIPITCTIGVNCKLSATHLTVLSREISASLIHRMLMQVSRK